MPLNVSVIITFGEPEKLEHPDQPEKLCLKSLALLDAIVISTNDFVTLSEVEGLCVIPRVSFSIYGVK